MSLTWLPLWIYVCMYLYCRYSLEKQALCSSNKCQSIFLIYFTPLSEYKSQKHMKKSFGLSLKVLSSHGETERKDIFCSLIPGWCAVCLQPAAVSFTPSLWGNSRMLSQHGGVCYLTIHLFYFTVVLCHLSFPFFLIFKSLVMFWSLFASLVAKHNIVLQQRIHLFFFSLWDLMDLSWDARATSGVAGSQPVYGCDWTWMS